MALAPSGPEWAAPTTSGGAFWLKASNADCRDGVAASLLWISAAARLSAMAPMTAGPRGKPKSRSWLVVPDAMPARWLGTVLTATAVTPDRAKAKPTPMSTSGGTTGQRDRWLADWVAIHTSPMAISRKPPPRAHRGLYSWITLAVTGISTSAKPCSRTNANAVSIGENSWIAESRMLVEYAVPRKANMPTTVMIEFTAKARLWNRSSRSSGAGDRFSAAMNRAKKTTATMTPPTTRRSDQPQVAPWMTANSRANSAMAMVIWPGQSRERPSGAEEFWAANATTVLAAARTATATNAHRQLAVGSSPQAILVTRPPRSGETKPPEESAAAQMAMPRARSFTVCVPAATTASVVGNSTAAPIPVRA